MAVYQGNHVAYGSGGRWHVQVVVTDDGPQAGPTTTVHYTYQVVFNFSISDSNNTINWTDPWGSGSANNRSFQSPGTHTVSGTHHAAANIQYGGGNSLHFRMYATGMAGGGTGPSIVEFDYPLPGRQGGVPEAPRRVLAHQITSTEASVGVLEAGAENGYSVDVVNYSVHRQSDNLLIGHMQGPYSGVRFTGLERVTNYVTYAQSHNAAGWGPWSAGYVFRTAADPPGPMGRATFSEIRATSVVARWSDPHNGGAFIGVRAYQYSQDILFRGAAIRELPANGTVLREGLTPGQGYYFRARAENIMGPGPWSEPSYVKTQAGGWINIDGTPRLAVPYVNDNGQWKIAVPYGNVNGLWKPVSG